MATQENRRPTVFVVDDDEATRKSLAWLLQAYNLRVEFFCSAHEFLANYDGTRFGCLLLDMRLPGMSGVELHEKIVREGVHLPTIFMTGDDPNAITEGARKNGIVAVLEKPYRAEQLIEAIREAIGSERTV
jgi:two-component system response regulator FixJ